MSWLVDSGSEQDLISRSVLQQINASGSKPAPNPITLTTANGFTEATEVADVKIKSLLEKSALCFGANTSGSVRRNSMHDPGIQFCVACRWNSNPRQA